MTTEKALKHLAGKIARDKRSTDYDKACINQLIEYFNKSQDGYYNHHEPHFKLYVYLYTEFIKHYEESSFGGLPQKELHKVIDTDHKILIQNLVDAINMTELYRAYKDGEPEEDPKTWEYPEVFKAVKAQFLKSLEL